MKIDIAVDSGREGLTAKISKTTMGDIKARKYGSKLAPPDDDIVIEDIFGNTCRVIIVNDENINGKLLVSPECKKIVYINSTSIDV